MKRVTFLALLGPYEGLRTSSVIRLAGDGGCHLSTLRCPKNTSGLRFPSCFSTAAEIASSLPPPLAAGTRNSPCAGKAFGRPQGSPLRRDWHSGKGTAWGRAIRESPLRGESPSVPAAGRRDCSLGERAKTGRRGHPDARGARDVQSSARPLRRGRNLEREDRECAGGEILRLRLRIRSG